MASPKTERIRKRSTSDKIAKGISYFLLVTGSILIFIPFYWMLSSSLKEPGQIFKTPPEWIPTQQVKVALGDQEFPLSTMEIAGMVLKVAEIEKFEDGNKRVEILSDQPEAGKVLIAERGTLTEVRRFAPKWENYKEAMTSMPFERYLLNTLIITFVCLVGQVGSASIVAYGFARLRFPGRDFWFIVLLATIMLPPQVTLIPIFKIFTTIGWYDTFLPLTVPAFFGGGVFFIFLLRQYYMTIPFEMDEAAKIDGAGTFGVFWKILLPQAKPALATVGIFSFMAHWNDFLGPLIYLSDPDKRTLALALWAFQGEHATDWHLLMAAATVIMAPLLLLFFCAQKYFIQGVVISGVKG